MNTQPETNSRRVIRIGTRGSPLALAQAEEFKTCLLAGHADLDHDNVKIVPIRTAGDRSQHNVTDDVGGKAVFVKEIEEALLAGTVDMAVHSMKDMETQLREGLAVPCLLPRADPRDAFVSVKVKKLEDLPAHSIVGTGSPRRAAQIHHLHSDIEVVPLRGNVGTRLTAVLEGKVDATLLAMAGLMRLGLADKATCILTEDEILPAVGQGAIGIECRTSDELMLDRLMPLSDADTAICVNAERSMLETLGGTCRTPIAGIAHIRAERLCLRGLVICPDGSERHSVKRVGGLADAIYIGREVGEELRIRAGSSFFESL